MVAIWCHFCVTNYFYLSWVFWSRTLSRTKSWCHWLLLATEGTIYKSAVFKSSICEDYYFVKHICLTLETTTCKHNAWAANSQRDADGNFNSSDEPAQRLALVCSLGTASATPPCLHTRKLSYRKDDRVMHFHCAILILVWSSNKGTIQQRKKTGVANAVPKLQTKARPTSSLPKISPCSPGSRWMTFGA